MRAWFQNTNRNGKNNVHFHIMAFFHVLMLLPYTVTINAYKVTARIALILSH